jgi:hypothetical protein
MAVTSNPNFWVELDCRLNWAQHYLEQFESKVKLWESSKPYTVSEQDDVLHGRHVRRLRIKGMDYRIPLLLSDFIYNLRSSLDHIAWQLSVLGATYPSDKDARFIAFPIHEDTDPGSQGSFARQVKYMPSEAVEIIRDLQPYQRGAAYRDDPLWQLNKLWNIDKHRTISMNGGHAINVYAGPQGYSVREFDDGTEFSWRIAVKEQVVFQPLEAGLILGDPVDTPDPFNIRKERVTAIHRHVRNAVIPRFARFFSPLPNP